MRQLKQVSLFVLAMGANIMMGCSGEDPGYGETVTEARSSLARPNGAALWPWGTVPICWTSTFTGHSRYVELSHRILEIVNDHFPQAANIQFEDAGPCTATATGVLKVNHLPGNVRVELPLGYESNGDVTMHLDLDSHWFTEGQTKIQQVVMHEFIHSLGFEHEFLRDDWTNPCMLDAPSLDPGWDNHGTSVDFDSMTASTYCHSRVVLSAGDVSGLQNAYGTPGRLQIHAVATESGADSMWHRWNGTTWEWQRLFPNLRDLSTRAGLASTRTGDDVHARAFFRQGTSLYADHWNGTFWTLEEWTNKVIDLKPAPVAYRDYGTGIDGSFAESRAKWHVFTRTGGSNAGRLLSNHYDGNGGWSWLDFGKPAGGNVIDVDALSFNDHGQAGTFIYAFVRAANNQIYLRHGVGTPSAWASLGKPSSGTAGPIAVTTFRECLGGGCAAGQTRRIHLWTVSNGRLWNLVFNGSQWTWTDRGAPSGATLVSEKPSPITWTEVGSRRHAVYVRDTQSNLRELKWNGTSWSWTNHGKPSGVSTLTAPSAAIWRNVQLSADPNALTTTFIARHVFVVGGDNKAYVRWTGDGTNWAWADQTTPYNGLPVNQSRGISAMAYWGR